MFRPIMAVISLVFLSLVSIGTVTPAFASTFTVNDTSDLVDVNLNDQHCLTSAGTCTLRAAVQQANKANNPDTITLPSGVFTLSIPGISEDLAATGDLDITPRHLTIIGNGPNNTIIDGGGLDRVFDIWSPGTTNIQNLAIRNGNALYDNGGGIRVNPRSSLILEDVDIYQSQANRGGGFATLDLSTLSLLRVGIHDNQGIAPAWSGSLGDAVYVEGNADVTMDQVWVHHNGLAPGYSQGGTILFQGLLPGNANIAIKNSAITDNGSTAINMDSGDSTLHNDQLTLTNVTIGGTGGMFATADWNVSLKNVTITGSLGTFSFAKLSVINSIVVGPLGEGCNINPGTITSLGHNISNGSFCTFNAIGDMPNSDPILGPLTMNGGFSPTYALLIGSPAIDNGDNVGCPATDQRLVVRPQDGNGDGIAVCDIGAYELVP